MVGHHGFHGIEQSGGVLASEIEVTFSSFRTPVLRVCVCVRIHLCIHHCFLLLTILKLQIRQALFKMNVNIQGVHCQQIVLDKP